VARLESARVLCWRRKKRKKLAVYADEPPRNVGLPSARAQSLEEKGGKKKKKKGATLQVGASPFVGLESGGEKGRGGKGDQRVADAGREGRSRRRSPMNAGREGEDAIERLDESGSRGRQ